MSTCGERERVCVCCGCGFVYANLYIECEYVQVEAIKINVIYDVSIWIAKHLSTCFQI